MLANVGYSHTVIANKLHRAKSWVTKWINRSKVDDLLVDKPRSGRPKVLSIVARKLIKKAKYRRGHGLRRLVKQPGVEQGFKNWGGLKRSGAKRGTF